METEEVFYGYFQFPVAKLEYFSTKMSFMWIFIFLRLYLTLIDHSKRFWSTYGKIFFTLKAFIKVDQ